ncbi:MAG TPA: NAD(P)/FAD-dependent oxidoreductase [Euzebyales bacterium]|nr:NAD(P)/FAD-dependent oxidoreductase [Euzebyales bacterium]
MTSALIIGGGVAGPVAAMALQRAGLDATIYEAHPRGADDAGSFLTLQINGIAALRAIAADHVVTGLGFDTPRMTFASGSGKYLGAVPTGGALADGTTSQTLQRADLYRALRDEALRRGARILYGKRLVDAHSEDGAVTAVFADGTRATGDLLIGSDGVRSRVRTCIDPAAPRGRYVPVLNVGGYAPGRFSDAPEGEYRMIFGRRAFFGYAVAPDGTTWWFANPPRREEPDGAALAAMTTDQWRAWLLDLYRVDRSPANDIIAATPGPLRGWATYDIPSVPVWHDDRMVVIGDAAHATSPSSGQGASMAIEDAVMLGRCLRDRPTIAAAFATYERLRRDRVERVVAVGARSSDTKVAGPVRRVFRDLFMPLFLRKVAADGAASLAWMHRYHIAWDRPVDADAAALSAGR